MEEYSNNFMDNQYLSDTIRCTGYRNVENAISEIIDNSIEAKAKATFIMAKESKENDSIRKITEVGFLDNGTGMDIKTLSESLVLGISPRRNNRKGIGRFGVGLTQSSMSVCRRVEVYSWQDGVDFNCNMTYLDLDEIKSGEQSKVTVTPNVTLPEEYRKYLNKKWKWAQSQEEEINFENSGTLVIWKKCDRNLPKKIGTLYTKLEKELGRKFRYLIESKKQRVFLIDTLRDNETREVIPNDPLFLMKENIYLGNPEKPTEIGRREDGFTEPIFEPYIIEGVSNEDGEQEFKVQYLNYDTGKIEETSVIAKFSAVKKEFRNREIVEEKGNLGGKPIGKAALEHLGVSIIRANREIDFGNFRIAKTTDNEYTDRWWGCEIRFQPELDEAFGVSNNKQGIIVEELSEEEREIYKEEKSITPVWDQILIGITKTIADIRKRNAMNVANSGKKEKTNRDAETNISNVEKDSKVVTITDTQKQETSEEEQREEILKVLEQKNVENPDEEDINNIKSNKVNIVYTDELPRNTLFSITTKRTVCKCAINVENIFYKKFIEKIKDNEESINTFETFLGSLARLVDEQNVEKAEKLQDLIEDWNVKLTEYIKSQYGEE